MPILDEISNHPTEIKNPNSQIGVPVQISLQFTKELAVEIALAERPNLAPIEVQLSFAREEYVCTHEG